MIKATQLDIAKKLGISRSTVQRALTKSGSVNKDVYNKIICAAKELNYEFNTAAQQLAKSNKYHVCVYLIEPQNYKINELFKRGFAKALEEATTEINFSVNEHKSDEGILQARSIMSLLLGKNEISAIIINPILVEEINKVLAKYNKNNIQVFTLDSDISSNLRNSFVGADYTKGGRIAAHLLQKFNVDYRSIAVIDSFKRYSTFSNRINGFHEIIPQKEISKHLIVPSTPQTYKATLDFLNKNEGVKAIYTTLNIEAVARAIIKSRRKNIILCGFDYDDSIERLLDNEVISFVLYQRPIYQGYRIIKIISEFLKTKALFSPCKEIVGFDIATKENIPREF